VVVILVKYVAIGGESYVCIDDVRRATSMARLSFHGETRHMATQTFASMIRTTSTPPVATARD
jgi:hypothetical protein